MSKVVACIIARTVSTRLPLKVLRDFRPHFSMLDFLIQNVKTQNEIDEVYLCTSREPVDDILEDVAARNNVKIYRGSPDQVIERMLSAGEKEDADLLIRITGDNPFTAVEFLPEQIEFLKEYNLDYVRMDDLPIGGTPEVFTFEALKKCNELMDPSLSEYLMMYMFEPENFKTGVVRAFEKSYAEYSLTVDTPGDFERTKIILDELGFDGDMNKIRFSKILEILEDENIEMPARKLSGGGMIRMPEGPPVTYETFKKDMRRRIEGSWEKNIYE